MGSIIVALPGIQDAKKIGDLLRKQGFVPDLVCCEGADVLRAATERDNGVVICGSKLMDMNYIELNGYLPEYFEMILLSHKTDFTESTPGIVRLLLPFRVSDLISTVEMILTQQEKKIKKNKGEPKKRSSKEQDEIKQAKLILMDRNNMTEPEAYRYIQKCSMDSGTNMVETAQMIILLNNER